MIKNRLALLTAALLLAAAPLSAYTVYLKDGAKLIAQAPPEIRGGTAIITLQNGTQSSIDASEIDLERTRRANQHELGSALILEGGEFTEQPTEPEPEKEKRLSDLIKSRTGATSRRPSERQTTSSTSGGAATSDLLELRRRPFRNLDIASEIQGVFRGQGVEQTRLFQGTAQDRVLIDLTTNSEAAVFRGLEVAATALVHLQSKFPGTIDTFELLLMTSSRSRAGQFLLGADDAARLAQGEIEASTFFVEHVRF